MAGEGILIKPTIELGPVVITNTVITTWVIMLVLWLVAWLVTRRLQNEPGPIQTAVEGIVATIESAVAAVAPEQTQRIMPFIASLWIFLVIANLSGLLPGAHSPTPQAHQLPHAGFLG